MPAHQAQQFVQIPVGFLRDGTLSVEAKAVAMVYASYANSDSEAWPGIQAIIKAAAIGRDRAKRGRAELVRKGYLKPMQPRGRDVAKGRFGQVRYWLAPGLLHRRTEFQASGKAQPQDWQTAGRNHRRTERPQDGISVHRTILRSQSESASEPEKEKESQKVASE